MDEESNLNYKNMNIYLYTHKPINKCIPSISSISLAKKWENLELGIFQKTHYFFFDASEKMKTYFNLF